MSHSKLLLAKWVWSVFCNPSEIAVVVDYIANQHSHHTKRTFQEEYKAFLKKYEVGYDERYLWD